MSKKQTFEDGSSVEWVDRETVKYTENGFSTLVWVDFAPGFFSGGRVIISSHIIKWRSWPAGSSELIDENKKREIIEKIKKYFGKKCREETLEERVGREKIEAKITSKKIFEGCSSIEPINRELYKYTEEGFSTTVRVVYKPGFFSGKWIIKSSSLVKWDSWPDGSSEFIDENKKQEIIEQIQRYFGKKCRVEI